ncbi:phosphoadenylyl-sulfate reductase [Verrucomicrobiaceae bacterium N1E253]|uniref:Phosphoadenosine 5'-phosphosulfate reductase n=1 Tax=Oceaniferula marina TaxID=2748318 RepID=A0A851GQI0_9BACT|nr:phosphoadenylyl-sulfate reductase [Oceaniferula marina]NWK57365.1 phosphoadenylyl-sulfate reductase [Oceaniferula marina]
MNSIANAMTPQSDVDLVNEAFPSMKAAERVAWLHETFGSRLVLSSSFGLQAAIMLHLISKHAPQIPVVWLDTGYLFPETYRYAEKLIESLGLDVHVYQPKLSAARQEALYGKLWEKGEEGNTKYGLINKVEPMNRALLDLGADIWISGLRRSHSSTRADRTFGEQQKKTLKVYPILDWADAQVSAYFYENAIPPHPLESQGYQTMGDWHSTSPVEEGGTAESSRFGGEKYECGLHLDSGAADFQI